jgi:hypothetical protein
MKFYFTTSSSIKIGSHRDVKQKYSNYWRCHMGFVYRFFEQKKSARLHLLTLFLAVSCMIIDY